jgi:hypothetical protein
MKNAADFIVFAVKAGISHSVYVPDYIVKKWALDVNLINL